MTSTAGSSDEQVSDIVPPRNRRRTLAIWAIVIAILGGLAGIGIWWGVASSAVHFDQGSMSYDPHAWEVRAGQATEYCFEIVPGTPIRFGFSLHNPTGHEITIKAIDQPYPILPQTVTMSTLNDHSQNPLGPELPFAPVTLRPDEQVMFYVTWQVADDIEISPGVGIGVPGLKVRYRTMGRDFHREVLFGYWLELQRPDAGKLPCQPDHFA